MTKKEPIKDVKELFKGEYKETAFLVMGIGMMISDLIPTPADAIWIMCERWLEKNRMNLSPEEYWGRKMLAYYLPNAGYWLGITLLIYYLKFPFEDKLKIFIGLISGGAIVGFVLKYILEDKARMEEMQSDNIQHNVYGGIYGD